MRNVLLSLLVIVVLAAGGLGGTFATWSDSETSGNNTITTGSLDLKVNGADDEPWGEGVGPVFQIECVVPDRWYYLGNASLWNAGECTLPAHAYVHVKDYVCTNVAPKEFENDAGQIVSTGYPNPGPGSDPPEEYPWDPNDVESLLKPEPELVAEYGGKVNCTEVNGIGATGDECSMGSHVHFVITGDKLSPSESQDILHEESELWKWECKEFYLFDLMPCVPRDIHMWVRIIQESEEDWGRYFIPNPNDPGYDAHQYKLFNDWPSWALMKDKVTLTIEFDLTLANLTEPKPTSSPT